MAFQVNDLWEIQMFSSYCAFLIQKLVHRRGKQRMDKTTHLVVARKSAKAALHLLFDFLLVSFQDLFRVLMCAVQDQLQRLSQCRSQQVTS